MGVDMSQQQPDPKAKKQPSPTELSAEELDRVTGGDKAQTQTTTTEIHFTKLVDKSSPKLF
jgi:type VI protein secretion system component Hcp